MELYTVQCTIKVFVLHKLINDEQSMEKGPLLGKDDSYESLIGHLHELCIYGVGALDEIWTAKDDQFLYPYNTGAH